MFKKLMLIISLTIINVINASISDDRLHTLANEAERWEKTVNNQYPVYKYPADAKQMVEKSADGKILIFGYGSLVNPESAARTLSVDAMKTYQPAVAFGMKRTFDRKVTNTDRWGPRERPSDVGMLNVFKTGDHLDALNGVTFEVNQEDLRALIEREIGYDLVPIPIVRWQEAVDPNDTPDFQIAYVFLSPEEERDGKVYVDPCVNPVPGYAMASKEGAALNGQGFLKLWLESTFLADKKTPFIEWEKNPHIDMSQTCMKKLIDMSSMRHDPVKFISKNPI